MRAARTIVPAAAVAAALAAFGLAPPAVAAPAGRTPIPSAVPSGATDEGAALELNEFETFETEHSVRRFGVAALVGFGYLPVAGMELLPSHTEAQKRIVTVAAVGVLLLFGGLLLTMARMARTRRRVRRDWKARQGPEAPPPDVIFFMTDGQFAAAVPGKVADLNGTPRKSVVNTILFAAPGKGAPGKAAAAEGLLKQIADKAGGTFTRYVP